MSMHLGLRAFALMFCASLLASCASTEVTKAWKDESRGAKPIGKVLVVAVAPRATTRAALEDEFVKQLKERGHDAQAAHTVLPADGPLDKARVLQLVQAQSIDTILVTRLLQKKTVQTEIPAAAGPGPSGSIGYYGSWNDYYQTSWSFASSPSHSIEHEVAVAETNLYDAQSEKLFWTAQSDTFLGDSAESLIRSFVEVMIGQMGKGKLL